MLHLHTDRLAALGDDIPTPEESAHLASCEVCARERRAYQSLVAMAHAEREPFGLPLTRWDSIASALERDNQPLTLRPAVRRSNVAAMRVAASVLLVAGGAIAGRLSVGGSPLPNRPASVASAGANLSLASSRPNPESTFFASVDDARAAQQRAEATYQHAAAFLAEHDSTGAAVGNPVTYRSRLAALDNVISTTREALRRAPHDSIINGYYLTTLGQREATLHQLNTSLPSAVQVNSF